MKRRRGAAARQAQVPPEVTPEAIAAMAGVVLAKAITEALGKGYAVQLIPGGDPHVWRTLADRAAEKFGALDRRTLDAGAWLADYHAAVEAYTLHATDVQAQAPPA